QSAFSQQRCMRNNYNGKDAPAWLPAGTRSQGSTGKSGKGRYALGVILCRKAADRASTRKGVSENGMTALTIEGVENGRRAFRALKAYFGDLIGRPIRLARVLDEHDALCVPLVEPKRTAYALSVV